jgi:putative redox protein
MTSAVKYQGDLRTTASHLQSGISIITDAPTDNNGKGQAFSPTDLVATALASCLITIMGIKANSLEINFGNPTAEVTKIMGSNPRRISEIKVEITLSKDIDLGHRNSLEAAAKACPVAKSLHPDLKQTIDFIYA